MLFVNLVVGKAVKTNGSQVEIHVLIAIVTYLKRDDF
jgi:hypothetical protein